MEDPGLAKIGSDGQGLGPERTQRMVDLGADPANGAPVARTAQSGAGARPRPDRPIKRWAVTVCSPSAVGCREAASQRGESAVQGCRFRKSKAFVLSPPSSQPLGALDRSGDGEDRGVPGSCTAPDATGRVARRVMDRDGPVWWQRAADG